MSEMNIGYCDFIKIMNGRSEATQKSVNKMIIDWEGASNLKREQAFFSFIGTKIWISENKMMTTTESISEVLSL